MKEIPTISIDKIVLKKTRKLIMDSLPEETLMLLQLASYM
jgi:hypothetical protein